ncbi:MAG: ABC transporter ATP-binding protein [Rhodospirillaceae bacterium]|nr:ABC transporter ATP-binding protein [Rhodospirillaceae bacterium]
MISLTDIRKSFGAVAAVDGVSLDIAPNEFLALLGASGCGKTTLLRVLAGFETPDAGRVMIAGQDVTSTPPHKRPVNLMFQSYALFPHMTVAQNVAFGLKQDGLRGAELTARVQDALALVEMDTLALRRPDQLSGGQQQRVALARCIAKQPKVLLLDEPMAALDRALRERTRLELMSLRKRLGISFVIVTHDQEDAMTMADRVAVMDKGKIVQVASAREVYERPASRLVASFFGEANIWDGVAAHGRVDCPALGAAVAVLSGLPAPGVSVAVSVRPERITISAETLSGDNVLQDAVIEDVVYLGTVTTYLVRVPGDAIVRVTRQNDAHQSFARGNVVSLAWPADAVVVLAA